MPLKAGFTPTGEVTVLAIDWVVGHGTLLGETDGTAILARMNSIAFGEKLVKNW